MLNPKIKKILELNLEFTARLWKQNSTNRGFKISHWLARQQFYRQKLLTDVNLLIEEIIWVDFLERVERELATSQSIIGIVIGFTYHTGDEAWIREEQRKAENERKKISKKFSWVKKNYKILLFQLAELTPLSEYSEWYQKKIESESKNDQNWILLTELRDLAWKEKCVGIQSRWLSIFDNYFRLLALIEIKSLEFEKRKESLSKKTINLFEQEIEKVRQNCRRTKQQEIEEHIQQLATNYLKKTPNLRSSQEVIIKDVLGADWKDKINENQISNIENEKRDYEVLFVKSFERFQRTRSLAGLYLIGFVYIFFFYPFYLYTKLYKKHKIPFWANLNDLSKEQQKKDKEISYIVAKRFFIIAMVWLFFGVFFNLINERL